MVQSLLKVTAPLCPLMSKKHDVAFKILQNTPMTVPKWDFNWVHGTVASFLPLGPLLPR